MAEVKVITLEMDLDEFHNYNRLCDRDEELEGRPLDRYRNYCPNCDGLIASVYDFCPWCGQRVKFNYIADLSEEEESNDKCIDQDEKTAEIENNDVLTAYDGKAPDLIGFDDPEFDKPWVIKKGTVDEELAQKLGEALNKKGLL